MAAGDSSALGTVALVDKVGQSPADPSFIDRISVIGDADYKAGGTGPATAGGIGGLLYALRNLKKDHRVIVGAVHLYSVAASGDTALTTKYGLTYNVVTDKIQVWCVPAIAGGGEGQQPQDEAADGTNRSAIKDIWLVFSK